MTSSKRGERVAPPPEPGDWDLKFATSHAVKGWEELSRSAPGNANVCFEQLRSDPKRRDARQQELKGALGKVVIGGAELAQWQYEITGAGRVWYGVDETKKIVWLTKASVGHPKAADR